MNLWIVLSSLFLSSILFLNCVHQCVLYLYSLVLSDCFHFHYILFCFLHLTDNVTQTAAANGGFAVGEVKGVFGLAVCWKTVSSHGCRDCLEKAANEVRVCLPSGEGRGLNAGCYLRYSTHNFLQNEAGNLHQGISLSLSARLKLLFEIGSLHELSKPSLNIFLELVKFSNKT